MEIDLENRYDSAKIRMVGISVGLVLKDSNMDSENLNSLIRLSLSDGQKTDSSNVVSFIGI